MIFKKGDIITNVFKNISGIPNYIDFYEVLEIKIYDGDFQNHPAKLVNGIYMELKSITDGKIVKVQPLFPIEFYWKLSLEHMRDKKIDDILGS